MVAADITPKLKQDFGPNLSRARELLADFYAESKGNVSDRLVRAIIYLAHGDLEELSRVIGVARIDYRDVLWQAEYEGGEVRLRDFNKSFRDLGLVGSGQ